MPDSVPDGAETGKHEDWQVDQAEDSWRAAASGIPRDAAFAGLPRGKRCRAALATALQTLCGLPPNLQHFQTAPDVKERIPDSLAVWRTAARLAVAPYREPGPERHPSQVGSDRRADLTRGYNQSLERINLKYGRWPMPGRAGSPNPPRTPRGGVPTRNGYT